MLRFIVFLIREDSLWKACLKQCLGPQVWWSQVWSHCLLHIFVQCTRTKDAIKKKNKKNLSLSACVGFLLVILCLHLSNNDQKGSQPEKVSPSPALLRRKNFLISRILQFERLTSSNMDVRLILYYQVKAIQSMMLIMTYRHVHVVCVEIIISQFLNCRIESYMSSGDLGKSLS